MSRASQFMNYINIRRLADVEPFDLYSKTKLTSIEITDELKKIRKQYLKQKNNKNGK